METKPNDSRADNLPPNATEFIRQVVREMGYHRKARQEVRAELTAHFEDELRNCVDAQEREQKAQQLVVGFGEAKVLAVLCRRGKKRCRPVAAKAMVRSLQTMAVLLVLLGLYVVWFVNGKPDIKVDYLGVLNQMNRPEIAERDNAWPHYERAMALVASDDELRDIPAYQKPFYPEHREFAGLRAMLWKGLAFIHAGRDQTVAKSREIFDRQSQFFKMSPYERREAAATRTDLAFLSRSPRRYALVQMLTPASDRPADLMFRAKAMHEATLTILALQRCRAEKGRYPVSLSELQQAGYLDALPADPCNNGPLAYKVRGDDFTLYSFGPDLKDDDGRPATDRKGRRQMWAQGGDTIFWPVP